LFLWITPFSAALSRAMSACRAVTSASSNSPAAINPRVFLMYVRARDRCTWLIRRFRSLLRIRLIADCVFANFLLPLSFYVLDFERHYSPAQQRSQTAQSPRHSVGLIPFLQETRGIRPTLTIQAWPSPLERLQSHSLWEAMSRSRKRRRRTTCRRLGPGGGSGRRFASSRLANVMTIIAPQAGEGSSRIHDGSDSPHRVTPSQTTCLGAGSDADR
jgi:hypothetical protein